MIVVILICTLIGYLVGHALIGLCVGIAFWAATVWTNTTPGR